MGLIYTDLLLSNPSRPDLQPIGVHAMADTGAITLCIPEHVANQLQLSLVEQREVTLGDGHVHMVPYVGPLRIQFANRSCFSGALVIGDEPLLGAIQMEDMDLILNPRDGLITVNPQSPNIPSAKVKGIL
jgi:clan AA aspartic protease